MRKAFLIVCSLLLPFSLTSAYAKEKSAGAKKSQSGASQAEQEVVKVLNAMIDARMKEDNEALGRLLADDYVRIASTGEVSDKAAMVSRRNITPGGSKVLSMVMKEVKVRTYGNTAVATGTRSITTETGPGELRFTYVLVQGALGWRIVSSQVTNVPKK